MIIVIGGVLGSGKSTVGDYLKKTHGFVEESFAGPMKEMVRMAFPAFTYDDLYGPSKNRSNEYKEYPIANCPFCGGALLEEAFDPLRLKDGRYESADRTTWIPYRRCAECATYPIPTHLSPRIALQTLGTEWGRRLYKDVWVDAAFARITNDMVSTNVQNLPAKNFVITDCRFLNEVAASKRNGGNVVKLTRGLDSLSGSQHPSETEFRGIPDSEFDYVLDNAKIGLDELPAAINSMLRELKWAP